jgi:hypothetical protein
MRRDDLVSAQPRVRLLAELTVDEAWALAQLLKRAGYTDYRRLAQSDAEADAMREGAERIRGALADVGIAPR